MSIKNQIERLSLQERRQLSHAFDHGFAQHVVFGDGEFVGVHLDFNRNRNLQLKEQVGVWSYGQITKGNA